MLASKFLRTNTTLITEWLSKLISCPRPWEFGWMGVRCIITRTDFIVIRASTVVMPSHHITNGNDIVLDSVQKYADYYFQANVWRYEWKPNSLLRFALQQSVQQIHIIFSINGVCEFNRMHGEFLSATFIAHGRHDGITTVEARITMKSVLVIMHRTPIQPNSHGRGHEINFHNRAVISVVLVPRNFDANIDKNKKNMQFWNKMPFSPFLRSIQIYTVSTKKLHPIDNVR